MEHLKWLFELQDRMSGPARRINKNLDDTVRALHRVQTATQQATGSGSGGVGRWTESLNAGMMIVGRLTDALGGLAGAFGRAASGAASFVVGQAGFRENSLTTLTAMLDRREGAGAGRRAYDRALQLAQQMPGNTTDLVRSFTQLASAGFSSRESENMFALISDMAARNPGDTDMPRRLATTLGQIRAANRLDGGNFRELTLAGVNRGDLLDQLAQGRGVARPNQAARDRMMALVSSGQIRGDEVFGAMMRQGNALNNGRGVGAFALSQGSNLTGLLDTLRSVPETLLQAMDFENSAGMTRFKNVLSQVVNLFNTASPYAQRLQRVVARLTDALGGAFDFSNRGVENFIGRVITGVERLVDAGAGIWRNVVRPFASGAWAGLRSTLLPAMRALGPLLERLGAGGGYAQMFERLGRVAGTVLAAGIIVAAGAVQMLVTAWDGALRVFNFVYAMVSGTVTYLETLPARFELLGTQLMSGLQRGIQLGAQGVYAAMNVVSGGVLGVVTSVFDMHSPSRVMMRMGGHVSEGFALGIAGNAGSAQDALARLTAAPVAAAGAGAGGPRGAVTGNTVQVTVQVPPGDYDAQGLAAALTRLLPSALTDAFDQLALERGLE